MQFANPKYKFRYSRNSVLGLVNNDTKRVIKFDQFKFDCKKLAYQTTFAINKDEKFAHKTFEFGDDEM